MLNYTELYHHGIKGQKWGVRRFQNKDGSLTPKGKKRRTIGQVIKDHRTNKKRKAALEKARQVKAEKKEKELSEAEKKEKILNSTDPKEIYENRHLLTYNELNDRVNRINLENNLAGKIPQEQMQTGLNKVNDMMRKTSDTINNATNLYKKVDDAYSTVTNSSIGKLLAKKLGMEPPKKEFNMEEAISKLNKMSTQEVMDLNKRLTATKALKKTASELREEAEKEAAEKIAKEEAKKAEKEAKEAKKKAQKQVDEYNDSWIENDSDSVRATDYRKKADDIIDGEFREIDISNVPSKYYSIGETFIAGMLEDKSR